MISRESGLSGTIVSSILRDKHGFIWIGTWNGLNRFDGYDMTVFHSDRDDSSSLSNSNINKLFEDRQGILWVATDNGLNSYDPVTGKFRQFYFTGTDEAWRRNSQINGITQDASGQIWLGSQELGLIALDKSTGNYRQYYNTYSERSNIIYYVQADKLDDRYLWVGTADGLYKFHLKNGMFELTTGGLSDASMSIQVIKQDDNGDLYVGTWGNGLLKFDRETSAFKVLYPSGKSGSNAGSVVIRAMDFDNQGNLVFFVRDIGLMLYNPFTGSMVRQSAGEIDNELNNKAVITMYIEPSGIIWIGTVYDGAIKLVSLINKFSHYAPFDSRSSGGGVTAILEDSDGLLWLGTRYGGISVINRKTLERKEYRQSPEGLSSNYILSLLELSENGKKTIWIGTDGGGLNRFDAASEKFTVYNSSNASGLTSNSVSSIIAYDSNYLLVGTRDRNLGEGLHVFNIRTGRFVNLRYKENDSSSLGSNNILKLFKDRSGKVWVGTRNGGLNQFIIKDISANNPDDIGYFVRYTYDPSNPSSLGNNTVFSIHDDSQNNLWLGTNEGGLTKFDPGTGKFERNVMEHYIKNQIIYGILADDHENLWLSTSRGIININLNNNEMHSFDSYDGLQESSFIYGSHFRSTSGEMFFGGIRGCNTFHPDSIRLNLRVPPIFITSLTFNGKRGMVDISELTGKSVISSRNVRIPYYQNNFSVAFSALDYQMPAKNRFRYILDGYDQSWTETDSKRRFASYTNIPPGKYIFRVIGSNSDDIWNHTGTSVAIEITPPFWNTTVFYLVIISLVSGIILLIFYSLIKKFKREKRLLEEEALSSVQDEKKQLRTLIDNIPDLIFIKDRQSRFTLANTHVATVMGTTPENLIGKTDFDFYDREIANNFFEDEQKIMETGIPMINNEESALDAQGNRIMRSTTKVPVKNKDGIIIGIAGICRDITKLKTIENQLRKKSEDLLETNRLLEGRQKEMLMQAEALALQTQNLIVTNTELDRLNRTKDKFFSIIAHDLRNPFNAIIGFSELLRSDFMEMDDHQKLNLLELISVSSQTAYNLLENLLQWARTQTDNINFDPMDFDLSESAKVVFDLYGVMARKKGIKFRNEIEEKVMVHADRNMVNTILRNLVSNAIKFSNPNGDIVLSAKTESDVVEVNVSDSGIGMTRENLNKLFRIDTYYSTAGTMGETGTGLGLIICKEFVEKNNGRIRATSSEGSGTTVTFTLNIAKNGNSVSGIQEEVPGEGANTTY